MDTKKRDVDSLSIWEDQPCCVCSSQDKVLLYQRNMTPDDELRKVFWGHYSKEKRKTFHFDIQKCAQCGHIHTSPYPCEETIKECYSDGEFDNTWELEEKYSIKTAEHYLQLALPFCEKRGCFVDVGCDVGGFLKSVRSKGFKKLVGIEPNQQAAQKAHTQFINNEEIQIVNDHYSDKHLQPSSASVISFIHVLDHLLYPDKILRQAYEHLIPGGSVIAVTHNIESSLAKFTGERFPAINTQHPQFFSQQSLKNLFIKTGFTPLNIFQTYNYYPLFHYIKYAPFIPEKIKDLIASFSKNSAIGNICIKLPLGNMLLVAKKL